MSPFPRSLGLRVLVAGLLAAMSGWAPAEGTKAPLEPGAHTFRSADALLWYRIEGTGAGEPIVFVHGGPGEGSQVFQAYGGPEVAKSRRVVYLDQRGAGRSQRPKEPSKYSIAILVEDIERLRRHLRVAKIVLLGHSFGTQLALEYAVKYPKQVKALVLVAASPYLLRSLDLQCERLSREDPAAYVRTTQGVRAGAMPRCDVRRAYDGDLARRYRLGNLFPDEQTAEIVERIDGTPDLRASGEVAGALFAQGLLRYRFDRAAQITAPVLILAGSKDFQAALEPQLELADQLVSAKLVVYPRNGHFLFVERPLEFARDVESFLKAGGSSTE